MSKKNEKIALFGGTFNPIHLGHLRAAKSAADICNIDRIYFIPSHIPPHRQLSGEAFAKDRYEMVCLAMEFDPRFYPCDFEVNRVQTSYSVNTVHHFIKESTPGTNINFLIGTDAFSEIDTWHKAKELFTLCDFLVMARPGHLGDIYDLLPESFKNLFSQKDVNTLIHKSEKRTSLVRIDGLELSSTSIREKLATGASVADLLCEKVREYISLNRLYES